MSSKPSLKSIITRLSELKPMLKSLKEEEDELKQTAMDMIVAKNGTEATVRGVGVLKLSPNTPQRRLDKDALKAYLVEKCKLAPSMVDKGFEAATKDGNVTKPYKVEFIPESAADED